MKSFKAETSLIMKKTGLIINEKSDQEILALIMGYSFV